MEVNKDKIVLNSVDTSYFEEIPSSTNTDKDDGTCNLSLSYLLRKTGVSSDPLDIMKQDPAVLEAFVTIDKKQKEEDKHFKNILNEQDPMKDKSDGPTKTGVDFQEIISTVESSLLSLTPHQLDLFMKYARVLRTQRELNQRQMECAFCKKNGKSPSWYMSHVLRDCSGCVRCPVLRRIRCPRCFATGDRAHTVKYCPENRF